MEGQFCGELGSTAPDVSAASVSESSASEFLSFGMSVRSAWSELLVINNASLNVFSVLFVSRMVVLA